jgi:dTDP-4-amino-4,6-dideoxygalactose transaminase
VIPLSKPSIGAEERAAVLAVLDSGRLAAGPRVATLEEGFASLCGVRHAVATSSGTTALHVSLLANGIGPEDEVITSSFTFVSTANSILMAGATPVFADVDPVTFTLDPAAVESAVTPRTRAILAVHLYGQVCDMDALRAVADRHGLLLLEDACQAVGASYRGRAAGSFGTAAFSLYATKNLAAGEGGMLTTDDDAVAERARLLRAHGMRARHQYEALGFNYRMTDLHAAIALAQLERLASLNGARSRNAAFLSEHLTTVQVPADSPHGRHVWHQYTVRLGSRIDRDAAVAGLARAGVQTGVFYPVPAHRQPHLAPYATRADLPVTEQLARSVLSLPVHPELTGDDLQLIVDEVNRL